MANEQNLIDGSQRSKNEVREIGRKGGKASGEARRRNKTMRELAEKFLLGTPLNDNEKSVLEASGITDTDYISKKMLLFKGQYDKAMKGDTQAFNAICAIIGEKPAEKLDIGGDIFSRVRVVREHQQPDGYTANSEDDIPDD